MEKNEKHLVFRIKDQLFTVPVAMVSTIIQLPRVFKVPQSPSFILGVINLEGNVIPLIDTSVKLGMDSISVHQQSQAIVMEQRSEQDVMQRFAFVADDVCDVVDVDILKVQPLPNTKFEFDERLVDGMHKVNDEFCMQINIENFYKGDINDLINSLTNEQPH